MKKALLFFDIETTPKLIYAWDVYETNALKVVKHSKLLAFSYKWQGEKQVKCYSLRNNTEKQLLQRLHKLLDEAEIVCGHNSKKFDVRVVNTFFIKAGMKPTSPYQQIDTLQIARQKFKFASNHLNDLGEYLGCGTKVKTGGIDLWFNCMAGNKKALLLMEKYNIRDTELLEEVYNKLIPFADNQPEIYHGLFCQKCGGEVQFRGVYKNKQFIGKRYQCKVCSSWGISNIRNRIKGEFIK